MLSEKTRVGQVTRCTSGRDTNRLFFIIKIIDSKYVLISDGKKRKLDRPKLKKVKHLKLYEVFNDEFICIRLTSEEKNIVRKLANCQKSNVQDFVKYVIFSKYIDDFIR